MPENVREETCYVYELAYEILAEVEHGPFTIKGEVDGFAFDDDDGPEFMTAYKYFYVPCNRFPNPVEAGVYALNEAMEFLKNPTFKSKRILQVTDFISFQFDKYEKRPVEQ